MSSKSKNFQDFLENPQNFAENQKEKEEFSDSSGYARPHTPNNSDMADEQSEKMMKGKEFAHYDFYDSTTEDIQDDQLKKKLGLRTSKSMPQIHKELNGLDIEL